MDKISTSNIIVKPLNIVSNIKGDIYHCIKKSDEGYSGFGEAYFSTINSGQIKGWNKHRRMTINLIVPIGSVKIVIVSLVDSTTEIDDIFEIVLSPDNYKCLTIPPGLWVAFKSEFKEKSLILNIANMEHDSREMEKLDLGKISYRWDK